MQCHSGVEGKSVVVLVCRSLQGTAVLLESIPWEPYVEDSTGKTGALQNHNQKQHSRYKNTPTHQSTTMRTKCDWWEKEGRAKVPMNDWNIQWVWPGGTRVLRGAKWDTSRKNSHECIYDLRQPIPWLHKIAFVEMVSRRSSKVVLEVLVKTSGRFKVLPRYSWYKGLNPRGKILPARG